MASKSLGTLLARSALEFEGAVQLTARAGVWQAQLHHFHQARFKKEHYTQIVELAFMRSFLTWESFLEEAFILYLLGMKAPSGYGPVRHAVPMSRAHAVELLASDARHTDWTAADRVTNRAKRFFKGGKPFEQAVRPQSNLLANMKTIRNALSHESVEATDKFETLVRNELTFLPPGMIPGTFLMTLRPHQAPPQSFFQYYSDTLRAMATAIVPT